ncbi:MAG: aspartate carbamoyltransferase catalytic subunit [Acidobacteria bacterium]|jgi:aspartate carbamoyltransferase catalytic subunit|nr:MAG: aspartate carbamoyltransferase catalytic subunit [Acidobacteriota bacterium]
MKKHLISVRNLSKEDLQEIYSLYKDFKGGRSEKLEGDVALLFLESSTRTRFSFERACRLLGLRIYFAGKGESSIEKGESFFDTLQTLKALGFKAVIFRLPSVLYPYESYLSEDISLLNAGDGTHQHPTQGLIDLFTALDSYGGIEGIKVVFVGDIAHSRVFRSSSFLFSLLGARLGVCGPSTLIPQELTPFNVEKVFYSLEDAIEWADLMVWLRLQEERFVESYIPSKESYFLQFGLTKDRYKRLRGYFMHPGPVNRYVDMDGECIYGEKSLVLRQVENGLFVRMAVLYWLLNG